MMHERLGETLQVIAEQGPGTRALEEAVAACGSAVELWDEPCPRHASKLRTRLAQCETLLATRRTQG